jgi:hypothetical protein
MPCSVQRARGLFNSFEKCYGPHTRLFRAAGRQFFAGSLAPLRRRLIPRQGRNPSHPGLIQLHGVVQCSRVLVEDQCDGVARNLVLIEQTHDARQGDGELFDIRHVARVDVVTQTQPVLSVQNIAQAHLAQVVAALLVVAALRQLVPRVGAGNVGVEVGGIVGQQPTADQLLLCIAILVRLWLANCYFALDSSGFPALLRILRCAISESRSPRGLCCDEGK